MRQIYSQVGLLIMLVVCGAAWRWGGRTERRAAGLIAVAWVATLAAQRLTGHVAPVAVLAILDVLAFGALLALSSTDRSGWIIYGIACQGVALCVHAIRMLSPTMSSWTYLTAPGDLELRPSPGPRLGRVAGPAAACGIVFLAAVVIP